MGHRSGSGLGSRGPHLGPTCTQPTHLVHIEPQGQQRDPETTLRSTHTGRGGHMQRFDGELGTEGERWMTAGLQALGPFPPRLTLSVCVHES